MAARDLLRFHLYTQVTDLAREALNNAYRVHGINRRPDDIEAFLELPAPIIRKRGPKCR